MAMKNTKKSEAGFTLLELLISLTILGIVLTGVVLMFTNTSRYNSKQEMMTDVAQDLRVVKNLMVDEIRSAGTNPEDQIRVGFQVDNSDDRYNTDANSIHFTRDIDNGDGDEFFEPDGDVDDPNEDIGYWRRDAGGNILNAGDNTVGTLVRNTGGGGQPVMDDVVDLVFQYYDEDNNLINPATMTSEAVLSNIRTVEVTIVGQVDRPNLMDPQYRTWTQQFRIRVRNL